MKAQMVRQTLALTLALTAGTPHAQSLRVFSLELNLQESCELEIRREQQSIVETRKLMFEISGKCRFLPHSETNIPRIEFINGEYVLLAESRTETRGGCRAELAAITVNREGRVRVSKKTRQTSVCGSAERKDFEILNNFS